jgi:hypothetical protein
MPITGVALKVARKNFFNEYKEKYKTTNEEIARELINSGHQGFKAENINQYRIILNAYFAERERQKDYSKEVKERIAKAADKAGEWRKTIFPDPIPTPCPIIGCDGLRLFGRVGSVDWKCTKGGRKHYNALKVAEMWGAVNEKGDDEIHEKATHFASLGEWNGLEETEKNSQEEICN